MKKSKQNSDSFKNSRGKYTDYVIMAPEVFCAPHLQFDELWFYAFL